MAGEGMAIRRAGTSPMPQWDDLYDTLNQAEFQRIADFIQSATRICLTPGKKTMVEGRLRRRARTCGIPHVSDYVAMAFDKDPGGQEMVSLIDAITTNKTDFFREPAHFNFLTREILPELAESGRCARFWSAACSIGAEPYTLAMVAEEYRRDDPRLTFTILASDISSEVLASAERAVYSEDMIEPVPAALRERYLLRAKDPQRKLVRIKKELRSLVRFARINLMNNSYPLAPDLDVVFCRNVLIYFDRETQAQVVRRLCGQLRKGGYLMLGHTDSVSGMDLPVRSCGNSIFRRI